MSYMSSLSSRRRLHFSATRKSSTFYWGGATWDKVEKKWVPMTDLNHLHEFNVKTRKWSTHELKDQHPPGLYYGACAAVGDVLYMYGGLDGGGWPTGSLFELNLTTMSWNELSHPGTGGPVKKYSCGMVNYGSALILFGGFTSRGKTNELHVFDIHSGEWSSPTVTGDAPAPDALFTFTKVSNHQVVLHGGRINKGTHVLDLSKMHWERRDHSESKVITGESLVAVCLGLDGPQAQLLLLDPVYFRSPWLLDLDRWKWMEIELPNEALSQLTFGCSVTAVQPSSDYVKVVLYGELLEEMDNSSHVAEILFHKKESEAKTPEQLWFVTEVCCGNLHFKTENGIMMECDNTSLEPINYSQTYNSAHIIDGSNLNLPHTRDKVPAPSPEMLMENKSARSEEAVASAIGEPDSVEPTQNFQASIGMNARGNSDEVGTVPVTPDESSATSSVLLSEKTSAESVVSTTNSTVPDQDKFASSVIEAVDEHKQIERKMANIVLKGLPEAGKSTLLDRLMGKPFKERNSSTGVSENVVVVDIKPSSTVTSATANDNSTWEKIDFDTSIYSQLGQLGYHKHFVSGTKKKSTQRVSRDCVTIKRVLSKHNIKSIEDLRNKKSLYIRDTGGQVEFQESLTLFINGPSIFIFVLKVNVGFSEKTSIRYRSPSGGENVNEYKSSLSTKDALIQFLTSVSAIATTKVTVGATTEECEGQGAFETHKPIVFIVGTHIDKLESGADSAIAEMDKHLHDLIQEYKFSDVVKYANAYSSKVMYTVDNTSGDDRNFKILRGAVDSYIGERREFSVLFPVNQLLFCLELQNEKRTVISIENFTQLASKFGIEPNQIPQLLHFLHFRIGVIQYYDTKSLADIVIKEPQVFFNKLTDLLVKTFVSSNAMNYNEQRSFSQQGILGRSTIENILGKREDSLTSTQFLDFMVNLHLAVPLNGRSKYFIPSVLNHVSPQMNPRKSSIDPLALCFKLGHCPHGLFGVLISHLLNPDQEHEFSFSLSEKEIYQDQIYLYVKSPESQHDIGEVLLKKHCSRIEVTAFLEPHFYIKESKLQLASSSISPAELCTKLRSILEHCLGLSLKTLRYDINKIQPMFCLMCHVGECRTLHEVVVGERCCMSCKSVGVRIDIPQSGEYWFKPARRSVMTGYKKSVLFFSVAALILALIPCLYGILYQTARSGSTTTSPAMSSSSTIPPLPNPPNPSHYSQRLWGLDSKPQIDQLLSMKCGYEELEIIPELASECDIFGLHLGLPSNVVDNEWDVVGAHVESKCRRIMKQWLKGKGTKGDKAKPVTWRTVQGALKRLGYTVLQNSLNACLQ